MQLYSTLLLAAALVAATSAYNGKSSCGSRPASFVNGQCYRDHVKVNFENYSLGNINGQDGWKRTNPNIDSNVVDTTGRSGFGKKALQISNAVSGSFGDQTFVKPLKDSVGESGSTASTFTAGKRYKTFEAAFDLAAVEPNNPKVDLHMSVSPDRGDGSRMSFLRFVDTPQGIVVTFNDVKQMYAVGDPNCYNAGRPLATRYGPCAIFDDLQIATLNRKRKNRIGFYLHTANGNYNDVVKIYINGKLVHTGTSWESYYKEDVESGAEQSVRIVKTLLFRASGHAEPLHINKGFLIDNIVMGAY